MESNLVQQSYWDAGYKDFELKTIPKTNAIRQWIEKYFTVGQGSCFEVGCFPGGYLSVFGDLGYELNGLDLTPRVETDLPDWLKTQGYRIGQFQRADFLDCKDSVVRYDIVCSFGFIEHFNNWESVLIKQALLVKDRGFLVVAAPNFRGFWQRLLHSTFDKENYQRHYIPAMDPAGWAREAERLGFEIVSCGYFGTFDFWWEDNNTGIFKKLFLKGLNCLRPVMRKLPQDKRAYSPYCGLIARKKAPVQDNA